MFRNFLMVLERELKFILTSKQAVFILLILPFCLVCLYGYLYQSNVVNNLKIGVVNLSPSQESRYLVDSFDRREQFIVKGFYTTEEEAIQALEKAEIQGIMVIPDNFTKKVKRGETADVLVIANGANMVISNNIMTGTVDIVQGYSKMLAADRFKTMGLSSKAAQSSSEPITFSLRPWYNPVNSYTNFLVPGLITVVIQQITFLFAAISVTEERKKGTLKTLLNDNVQPLAIIFGKMLAYFTCVFISSVGCFLAARFLLHIPMRGSFLDLFILSAVFLLCVSAIGIFISIICKNSLEATQYSMLVALPSFLLSGFTWPIQAMPEFCVYLSKILPLTYYSIPVRNIMLMGLGLASAKKELITLGLMAVVFVILSWVIFKLKFMKKETAESQLSPANV